ncbi:uncharacterized protein [Littorina saxatilis]|uniref:Uncharacterized protein n=1 Tax=Littorina saxatilis TaxID=31220 RepID=A0AAN9AWG9_9CAEN
MSSWPITDDIPVVDAHGQCALCDEVFPFVNVLTCRRLKGGEVPICLTCHQRFHPACTIAQSVLTSHHCECRVCGADEAAVVCALCSMEDSKDEILEGVLMCQVCSDNIHIPSKRHHSDHFYPVASLDVVSVRGPVQWHNFVDIRCEISANQIQSRCPTRQQISGKQPCLQGSANQHRDNNPRGGASSLKHLVIGGHSSQSQATKKKGSGSSFEKFGRVM